MFRRSPSTVTAAYFYARFGPPDDYPPNTRIEWAKGGAVLYAAPELIDAGLPVGIWRVDDVRFITGEHGRLFGQAFTFVERVPTWRWLGERGEDLLALIDAAVSWGPGPGTHSHASGSPSLGPARCARRRVRR